ncbi:MAG: HU family DNA-binding protein, partial [Miltoncostaeaceae bacterium]
MTKADFVKRVARAADLTNDQATRAVQAVLDELELALKAGDEVQFSGFGKNKVRYKDFEWWILESEHLE